MNKFEEKIQSMDWILITGIVLAPMTGFRVWKIGPGEILCLCWGVRFFIRMIKIRSYIIDFFLQFLFGMGAGTIIGAAVAPNELVLSDWFTWIYLMTIAFSIYTGLHTNTYRYNYKLLYTISVFSTLWYAFLYLYSLTISQSFMGVQLWYGEGARYSGGATNPHQVGTLFAVNIFILLKDLIQQKNFFQNSILILIDFFLLSETKASTGILSVFLATVSLFLVIPFYKGNQKKSLKIFSIEITAVTLICILFFYPILDLFINFIKSDANGEGRFELFSHIVDVIRKSPLFGLGPGVHSIENGNMAEFHNTYIEIYAATGITGVAGFIIFLWKLFQDLKKDILSVPIVVSLFIYACAGFTMRRLIFWGIIIIVIVTAQANYNEEMTASCGEKKQF